MCLKRSGNSETRGFGLEIQEPKVLGWFFGRHLGWLVCLALLVLLGGLFLQGFACEEQKPSPAHFPGSFLVLEISCEGKDPCGVEGVGIFSVLGGICSPALG